MVRLFATLGFLALVACDSADVKAPSRAFLGCYFSDATAPLHLGRNVIQSEDRELLEGYRFEPSSDEAVAGTIILKGVKVAAFQEADGKFAKRVRQINPVVGGGGGGVGMNTHIPIRRRGESFCFDLPTVIGEPIVAYCKADCDGAFGM